MSIPLDLLQRALVSRIEALEEETDALTMELSAIHALVFPDVPATFSGTYYIQKNGLRIREELQRLGIGQNRSTTE